MPDIRRHALLISTHRLASKAMSSLDMARTCLVSVVFQLPFVTGTPTLSVFASLLATFALSVEVCSDSENRTRDGSGKAVDDDFKRHVLPRHLMQGASHSIRNPLHWVPEYSSPQQGQDY